MPAEQLELEAVIGFGGRVPNGLIYHPDGKTQIYPMGTAIVLKDLRDNTQKFLRGHTDNICCVALSNDGKLLASGQKTHMGFNADVLVWDLETMSIKYRCALHKVEVTDLAFNCDDSCLATLGGRDDNRIIIWNLANGKAIREERFDGGLSVRWFTNHTDKLVSGGHDGAMVWNYRGGAGGKMEGSPVSLGKMQRVVSSIAINKDDTYAYVGTHSGDLLIFDLASAKFRSRFIHDDFGRKGVRCTVYVNDPSDKECGEYLLAGCGDGVVAKLIIADKNRRPRPDSVTLTRLINLKGAVSSISIGRALRKGHNAFIGTEKGNSYIAKSGDLAYELRGTSHYCKVNDIAFPAGCADLFVTCSYGDVRVWDAANRQELMRITVPNMECTCLCLTPPGSLIITGWDDGKIRAFYPESGKLAYVITDAHQGVVSALACTFSPIGKTKNTYMVVSGGSDGRVRLWKDRKMLASLKEHKGVVTKVVIRKNDSEIVSSSADGSSIIWDAKRHVRLNAFFDTTMFKAIVYHPDESQLLTAGSDRKITYWDASDANAIRVIEGSDSEINALDIEADGTLFVSGGEDRLIKVWHYDEGCIKAIGEGHSAGINRLCISPDRKFIVSVGSEGAIFIWKMFSE